WFQDNARLFSDSLQRLVRERIAAHSQP
ncbi:MAG: hypothetical protein JWL98_1284, partial [Xanthomonadaceae bacterium]|nr:hypothetical protein [Xanthomonadaceae bacterium]